MIVCACEAMLLSGFLASRQLPTHPCRPTHRFCVLARFHGNRRVSSTPLFVSNVLSMSLTLLLRSFVFYVCLSV